MKFEYLVPILIGLVQLLALVVQFNLKRSFLQMIDAFNHTASQEDQQLNMKIIKIVSLFRKADEEKDAQDIFTGQTAAQVIEKVTEALEAITLAKTTDVKIIISNDKTTQECFEVKLSFRLDDQV